MARAAKSGKLASPEPRRLSRTLALGLVLPVMLAGVLSARSVRAEEPARVDLRLFVDDDDDDDDGIADGQSTTLSLRATTDVRWLTSRDQSAKTILEPSVRLIAGTTPLAFEQTPSSGVRLGIQALKPGVADLEIEGVTLRTSAIQVMALDASGASVDLATSHVALARGLPTLLNASISGKNADPETFRWLLVGSARELPPFITLVSLRPNGNALAALEQVPLSPTRCPVSIPEGLACQATEPIRAVWDALEASHPALQNRALRAEVGGRISVFVGGEKAASVRVGGPRASALGPLGRHRANVRVRLIRESRGGAPPLGDSDASALQIVRSELAAATALWGQCGIQLAVPGQEDVKLVDPPIRSLLAIGCELGAPASGGEIHFTADKRPIAFKTQPGQTPAVVAQSLSKTLSDAGFQTQLSPNAAISNGALRTVDLLVKNRNGEPVEIGTLAKQPLSTDPSLSVCLGDVDLGNGLRHFNDFNASAGTLDERSIIRAYDDGDPTTIDVYVVPSFASSGRIGESFILGDGASIQNVVIVDRAGIQAGPRSFALAHELGHIFLDMPGHPDDFGVDKTTSLMDADASDPTIFGPRQLSLAECERALEQSGPTAAVPLLAPWPLFESSVAVTAAPSSSPASAAK